MKKSILSAILVAALVAVAPAHAEDFSDVPPNHPQYAAIMSLKNLAIVNGYQDGTFGPANSVTRSEAIKMILNGAKVSIETVTETGFPDVAQSAWYAPFTFKAKSLGIIKGYGDTGQFIPDRQVSKAEFLKMLLQAFQKDISKHENLTAGISPDTAAGQWYLGYMSYAKTIGIIAPLGNGNLEPNKPLNRADCAEIIYNLLLIERGGDTQKFLKITESNLVDLLIDLQSNDIVSAKKHAEAAVSSSNQALQTKPEEGIVKAANKIALGFQKLILAYEAGLNQNYNELRQLVDEAKTLAGEAFSADPSTQSFGKKIKTEGDVLLGQIPTE